ncbi:MAG: gamma-glutamylcyclotransferase [Thermostichales cyanobacterium BF3_bins_165]
MLLAVNGTLMRGLPLNPNLLAVGATFVREDHTAPCYRLWSIHDHYPAMIRDPQGGASIALELWQISPSGLVCVLEQEPPGLSIGRIQLASGDLVLGVLGEPWICQGQPEITSYGGWRSYIEQAK